MNNSKYHGVVVPMVTPVTQDGRLDTEAVKRIINFFAENKGGDRLRINYYGNGIMYIDIYN